jgi:cupin fold WbuC family metalloprotein
MTELITQASLQALSDLAQSAPRLRKNHNFHAHNESQSHRLLNAFQPGSYVQPHRHLDPEKDETMIVLKGRFGLVLFDETGSITDKITLSLDDVVGITIPMGTYHTIFALEPHSVFFESKAGPYAALTDAEKASWAPTEGDPQVGEYLNHLVALFA